MSLGRPGIFSRPPVSVADGSLWYLDSVLGWKASGSALAFDGASLTAGGPLYITDATATTDGSHAALVVTGGITSGQTVGSTTGFAIYRAAGTVRDINWYSGTSARWGLRCNNTAESGGNAGSDLQLIAYQDDGVTPATALTFTRSTRAAAFSAGISATSVTDSGLTATRVTFAGTGGLLTDSGGLIFTTGTTNVLQLSNTSGRIRVDTLLTDVSATYNYSGTYNVNVTASAANSSRGFSIESCKSVQSGIADTGSHQGGVINAFRNYSIGTADSSGSLTTLKGLSVSSGHQNTNAVSPVTSTVVGIDVTWQAQSGTITDLFGFRLGNPATGGTVTNAYGLYINSVSLGGTLNYAIFTNSGLVKIGDTTEATSTTAAAVINAGGQAVAKRSFLGTIASSFKGNVIAGVQDGTADTVGAVGERLSSVVAGVAVAATGTAGNITSLSVTAGKWLIYGFAVLSGGATGLTAGSTAKVSIVTTTATNGTSGATMAQELIDTLVANDKCSLSVLPVPVNISATTTYYLTEEVTFAAGSPTADGTLVAVRIG